MRSQPNAYLVYGSRVTETRIAPVTRGTIFIAKHHVVLITFLVMVDMPVCHVAATPRNWFKTDFLGDATPCFLHIVDEFASFNASGEALELARFNVD